MSSMGMRILAGSRDREAIELTRLIALRDLRNSGRSGLRFADVMIVSSGSVSDDPNMSAARLLRPAQRLNSEAQRLRWARSYRRSSLANHVVCRAECCRVAARADASASALRVISLGLQQ